MTEEDLATKFTLHVANELGEADYKVILSMNKIHIGKY